MSTQGRRKNTSVIHKLTESAYEYSFVQAVRLLERSVSKAKKSTQSKAGRNPVSGFAPPGSEVVRFASHQSLAFPSSEIEKLEQITAKDGNRQWSMLLNLIGLSGSMGVLPYHYTELILERQKHKDENLEHFLNLFNHRTASLLFQASIKYRLPLQFERNELYQGRQSQSSSQTQALLSLIGLGDKGLCNRQHTRDESLLYFGGLFNQRIRTASNLRQILRWHFNIPVEVDQFVGQWQEMIDDVRSRLPDIEHPSGCNSRLGRSAMLGKSGWFSQGKIRIVLGPLNNKQLKKFAPGTKSLTALNELVRMYVGVEYDYDFIIRIHKNDIPEKSCMCKHEPLVIGWNTWLRSKPRLPASTGETLEISISASRLN